MQLNFSVPFNTQTDASGRGTGGTWRRGEGEEKRPVAAVSRKLVLGETPCSVGQLECLAIKWTIDRFKYRLLGTELSLENGHRALQWLETMKLLNYLLAAVSTAMLLHIKCPQVSFPGMQLPVPHSWSLTRTHIHSVVGLVSFIERVGQLRMQEWHFRFICLLLCLRK